MSDVTFWHWLAFGAFVVVMLALDLLVFHRKAHEPSLRESGFWTCFWVSLALGFNLLVLLWLGRRSALEFLTGYLIEWSLSMDNVFVFAVIFGFFRVPLKYQYRVLFWGILGAVVMRLSFILIGATLLHYFDWMMLFFGALLIYSAVKFTLHDDEVHPDHSIVMRLGRRLLRVSRDHHGDRFFVREGGKLCATPLFLVLLVIEGTDVMFAIDSVPAIFSITRDPFIVFTSNVFAILGLRALYFLLAGVMDMFRYLKYGLSGVLGFVGTKMIVDYMAHREFIQEWLGFELDEGEHMVPIWMSLVVIVVVLGTAILASVIAARRDARLTTLSGGHGADPKETSTTT